MSFGKSLATIGSGEFADHLFDELQSYISCLNVSALTRCGGHATDPQLLSILKATCDEKTLTIMVAIEFNDGDALDCSGHCGGSVVQRRDTLIVAIERDTGNSNWSTADGVITNEL